VPLANPVRSSRTGNPTLTDDAEIYMNTKLIVLDPRKESSAKEVVAAVRLESLTNKRLGLLWNNRQGGDRILNHVADLLPARGHSLHKEDFRGQCGASRCHRGFGFES
jgi:hypothetical protein